ncbi:hypothetical protein [Maritalea sp.]|jgi:hypothetical protein|uniref:hypothetical protein n=1 Tax=Maritalea sp. TaxID=2003361 RepID=UPI0039E4E5E2
MRCLILILIVLSSASPAFSNKFRFEDYPDLDQMKVFLEQSFSTDSSVIELRATFVESGQATLISHSEVPYVEKYIYDINLCRIYVWRWNISADYTKAGKLVGLYLNGDTVLENPNGDPASFVATPKIGQETIFRGQRPRPQADLGETSLGFLGYDQDNGRDVWVDMTITGTGPSRADPNDLGKMHAYNTNLWRSIFDPIDAKFIANYSGDCPTGLKTN